MKPKVGDKLFLLVSGWNTTRETREAEVTKVGRKYFICDEIEFHIDNWQQKTEFIPRYRLYRNRQEWADEKRMDELTDKIKKRFSPYGNMDLTLNQLEAIAQIIWPEEQSQ